MISVPQLDALAPQTRQVVLLLMAEVAERTEQLAKRDREVAFK